MPPLDLLPALSASLEQYTRTGVALWDWLVGDVSCEWSAVGPHCEAHPDPSTLLCDLYESSATVAKSPNTHPSVSALRTQGAALLQRHLPEAAVGMLCQARRFAATPAERSTAYTALGETVTSLPWLFESGFAVATSQALFTQAVAVDPHNARARLLHAAFMVTENPAAALAALPLVEADRARWEGSDVDYYRLRAKVGLIAGDPAVAVAEAERLISIARGADVIEARLLRAEGLLAAARADEALEEYLSTCAAVSRLRVDPEVQRGWWGQGIYGALEAARGVATEAAWRRVYASPFATALPLEDLSHGMRFQYQVGDDTSAIRLARGVLDAVNAEWASVVALPDGERGPSLERLWTHKKSAQFIGSWALARLGHDPEPQLGKRPPRGQSPSNRLLSDPLANLFGMYDDPFVDPEENITDSVDITTHPLAFVSAAAIGAQAALRTPEKRMSERDRGLLLVAMRPEVTIAWVRLSDPAEPDAVWSAEQVIMLLQQCIAHAVRHGDAEAAAGVVLQLHRFGDAHTGTPVSGATIAAIQAVRGHFTEWVTALRRLGEGHEKDYRRQQYSQRAVEFARLAEAYASTDIALKSAKIEALVQLHRFSPATNDPMFQTERVLREALETIQAVVTLREQGRPNNDPSIAPVDLQHEDGRAEQFQQIAVVWERKVSDLLTELQLYRDTPVAVPLSDVKLFDALRTTCALEPEAATTLAERCTALDRQLGQLSSRELLQLGWVASEFMEYLADSRVPKGVPSNTPEDRSLRYELTAATLVSGVALLRMTEWFADEPEGWLELSRWFYNLGKKEESFERSIEVAQRVITVVGILREKQLAGDEQFGDAVRNTCWTYIEAARKLGRSSVASAKELLTQVEPLLKQADKVVLLPIYRRDLVYLWIKYYIVRQNLADQRRIWAAAERFGDQPKLCVRVNEIAAQDPEAMRYYDLVQRRVTELEQLEQRPGPLWFAKAGIAHHWGKFSEAADWYEKALSAEGWPADARQERLSSKDELADVLKNYLCSERPAYPESCRVAERIVELTSDLTQAYANSQEYADVLRRSEAVRAVYCRPGVGVTPGGAR
ncbi:MAG: hypothetical protein HY696_10780 [Deltaproteobacteria bacterium]|nr:hypothetical protein [Deltaproteobacteria bacterium]